MILNPYHYILNQIPIIFMNLYISNTNKKIFSIPLSIFMLAAYIYNLDWPQALFTPLQDQFQYSPTQINLFYTASSALSTLLLFYIGMWYDRISMKYTLIIIPSLVTIFQLGSAISMRYYSKQAQYVYYINLICRIFFGVFGSSLFILQSKVMSKLFQQKASNYIGFGQIVAYIFSTINSLITPQIYKQTKLIYLPLFVGFGIGIVSIICGIILTRLFKRTWRQVQQDQQIAELLQKKNISALQSLKSFKKQFWALHFFIYSFFSLTVIFITTGTDLLVQRFNIQYVTSGRLLMIPYLSGITSSVIWWYSIKKFNNSRRFLFCILSILCVCTHILIFLIPNTTVPTNIYYGLISLSLILIGICFSGFYFIVFPTISLLTTQEEAGAAYAFGCITLSIAYIITPLINTLLIQIFKNDRDESQGYKILSLFYVGLGILTLLLCFLISRKENFRLYDVPSLSLMEEQTKETNVFTNLYHTSSKI